MSDRMPYVYLAGPITGLSCAQAVRRRARMKAILTQYGFHVLSPMRGKHLLSNQGILTPGGYTSPILTDRAIFDRDHWDVTVTADIILVDLYGATDKSLGTTMELAWAAHLKKPAILIMEEGNPHDHAFIRQSASVRVHTRAEAVKVLLEWVGMEMVEEDLEEAVKALEEPDDQSS